MAPSKMKVMALRSSQPLRRDHWHLRPRARQPQSIDTIFGVSPRTWQRVPPRVEASARVVAQAWTSESRSRKLPDWWAQNEA